MTDEEIKALVDEFNRKVSLDPEIRSVMQKIRNQDADFSDTSRMFWRRSELLRNYLQGIVLDLPAGAREQLCTALLNAGYNETNEVMQSVQQAQDEPQGIHLNPVLPKCPAERIHTVAHALEDPTVPDDKIVRRAGAPVANVHMSFHDKYIEENAKIRAKLGMKPYITRYGSGCCKWCSEVAGRYRFGDQPKDIFRRHDNCGCTIIYDNQVLRGHQKEDGGSSRAWEEVDPAQVEKLGFTPTINSHEQAKKLQEKALEQLTLAGERDIIKLSINLFDKGTPIYLDAFSIEEEPGFEDVHLHGSPNAVQITRSGKTVNVSALEFADILKHSGYKGGDIRLCSCSTGKGNDSFAQQLSKILGCRVKAPDDDLYYAPSEGTLFVGDPYTNIGKWRIFNNGVEQDD